MQAHSLGHIARVSREDSLHTRDTFHIDIRHDEMNETGFLSSKNDLLDIIVELGFINMRMGIDEYH